MKLAIMLWSCLIAYVVNISGGVLCVRQFSGGIFHACDLVLLGTCSNSPSGMTYLGKPNENTIHIILYIYTFKCYLLNKNGKVEIVNLTVTFMVIDHVWLYHLQAMIQTLLGKFKLSNI